MKKQLTFILAVCLWQHCRCLSDDAQNNLGGGESNQGASLTDGRKHNVPDISIVDETKTQNGDTGWGGVSDEEELPHTNVGQTGEHDKTVDQEALVGGKAARKRLNDMHPNEAREEIKKLVYRIDTDKDGFVTKEELIQWLRKTEDKATLEDVHGAFVKEDLDKDGYITFEEIQTNSGEEAFEIDNEIRELEQKRFSLADLDKDRRLDSKEFGAFANPSHHEYMLDHLVMEQLRMFDRDKDGYIGFDEYMVIYNPGHSQEDEQPVWVESEKEQFKNVLDTNRDGKLDKVEIRKWLTLEEDEFVTEEAEHLIMTADQDQDERLSVDEIMKELDIFLDSPVTNFGHLTHEEL